MKINWKVRFKNPLFVSQIVAAIFVPIFAYFGMSAQDLTSWPTLIKMLLDAISNPYVLMTVALSLYNATTDPTTWGNKDSRQALKYHRPKKERK